MNLFTPFIILTLFQFSVSVPFQRIDCGSLKYIHCLSNAKLIMECNKQELCHNTTQLVPVLVYSPNICQFCQLVAIEAIEYYKQESDEEGELEQEFCDSSNSTCLSIVDKIFDYVNSFSSENLPSYSQVCKALSLCSSSRYSTNQNPDLAIDIDIAVESEEELKAIYRILNIDSIQNLRNNGDLLKVNCLFVCLFVYSFIDMCFLVARIAPQRRTVPFECQIFQ